MRLNEFQQVLDIYHRLGLNVTGIDAREHFYTKLAGKSNPEEKEKSLAPPSLKCLGRGHYRWPLALPLYRNSLTQDLEDVALTLPATYAATKALSAPTAIETRFLKACSLFATFSVAKQLTSTRSLQPRT